MTRINCIPVEELTTKHLCAEYYELPRVFGLVHKAIQRGESPNDKRNPTEYTLGTGHVRFHYNKLKYLAERQAKLVAEMQKRGYHPQHTECLSKQWGNLIVDKRFWNDYSPTQEAININKARIEQRLKGE